MSHGGGCLVGTVTLVNFEELSFFLTYLVRLMCDNAETFNEAGCYIYRTSQRIRHIWERVKIEVRCFFLYFPWGSPL